jgi:hypothetical protein
VYTIIKQKFPLDLVCEIEFQQLSISANAKEFSPQSAARSDSTPQTQRTQRKGYRVGKVQNEPAAPLICSIIVRFLGFVLNVR